MADVLLQINQICKAYGANVILDDATASFGSDQKIGMIGRNGAGKSTLCRIITEHEAADSGTISRNAILKLSYLEQHDTFGEGESVLDFLTRTTGAESWECGATAARFKITHDMLSQAVRSMPGGYQTRVKLAAMLLRNPNFLVLDEPSNYLDLSTMILLENFLLDFRGGYLIVSHDREFLKRTCDHTLELEAGKLTLYPGGIEEYFEFKEIQREQKRAHNRTVQKKRDQLQEFVDRFRAKASTASRAQSKLKQLEKLKTIGIEHHLSTVRIHIPPADRKAGIAFSASGLEIGYPGKSVAKGIDFEIKWGEHVAVLGDNGQGKTTLMRTITGDLAPQDGAFRWRAGIRTAYYAQHVFSALHPEDTIYGYLSSRKAEGVTEQEVLAMAGCFLFKGDDVKKKVEVLSGGERSRLILAGILLTKSQVLLLDEPTNHLDFETVEALARALKQFPGTIFFISHDRTFVNMIATYILEIRNGRVRRYPGTYEDYVYHLEQVARGEKEEEPDVAGESRRETPKPGHGADKLTKGERVKETHAENAKLQAEITKLNQQIKKQDQRIQHFTKERDKLLEEIRKSPFHYSKARNLRLKELQVSVEESEEQWYALQEKLDKLKK